jgi:cyclopropane-fatty-acyl-phospholipid synthase
MLAFAPCERSKMFDVFFSDYYGTPFCVRLWDGWHWKREAAGEPQCTLVFNSPRSLEAMLARPSEVTLGDAFLKGDLDVEGDLFAAFQIAEYVFRRPQGRRRKIVETLSRLALGAINRFRIGSAHSVKRDQWAISHHYDQPVAFFKPWLGESLVYSCAYFEGLDDQLGSAQTKKLELVCRKLRLKHDDHFLDIGCGWGSLILHAATQHSVYAQGITISQEQAAVATARIEAAKMTQSCRADLLDYRLASNHFAPFDKIASLGMFEHVGMKHLPEYFETVRNMLKPGGVFLNHGIARAPLANEERKTVFAKWVERSMMHVPFVRRAHTSSFIDRYVFPDGELATISEALTAAEEAGFEVRDVENLREHYELTLRAWVENLQSCKTQIIEDFSELTYRTWLLYMAGSAAAFRRGDIAVYQTLLCRSEGGESHLPLTRSDWYQTETADTRPTTIG